MLEAWFASQELGTFYIISQIFAIVSVILDLIAIQRRRKATLLNVSVVSAFCAFLHYAFLGAWAGIVSKIITIVRNAIAAGETSHRRQSPKLLPVIFVGLYIVAGFFTFESACSLLPILAPSIYTIAIYTTNVTKIRYVAVLADSIWLVYNISIFSIAGMIAQVLLITNDLIAIWRYRKPTTRTSTTR